MIKFLLCGCVVFTAGCASVNTVNQFPDSRINIAVETPIGVIYPQSIVTKMKTYKEQQ